VVAAGYLGADAQAAGKGALCCADEQELLMKGAAVWHLRPERRSQLGGPVKHV